LNAPADPLHAAHRTAYALGLALCVGTPTFISILLLSGWVPPGTQSPEGFYQQVGYLFTGIVFLAAAWVWTRVGQVLRGFKALPLAARPATVLREGLLWAALLETSCLLGLAYWILVGHQAARHAWGFILLTPALFLGLVPRYGAWRRAAEG
jgi:hypothetical protein